MNGPLNYYRTFKERYEEEIGASMAASRHVLTHDITTGLSPKLRRDLPVLFMYGTLDPTTIGPVIRKAHKFIDRLQDVALEDKGHWVLFEAADAVTEQVLRWLDRQGISPSYQNGAKL